GPLAGQVHGTQRVLESRMLRRGEHPPGALQLVNPAQALQPGAVDQILLRRVPGHSARPALRDAKVSVDGIAGQIHARVLGTDLVHAVDGYLAAMKGQTWPELTMPRIDQE